MATRFPRAAVLALDRTAACSESDTGSAPCTGKACCGGAPASATTTWDRKDVMAEARNSLHGLLAFPQVYRSLQRLLRKEGTIDTVVSHYLGPLQGRRLLDVGCGPGNLRQFLGDVNYTGIDRNARYICEAQER